MKPQLEAAGVIALLLLMSVALGIEFGGSGLAGALGGLGPPGGSAPNKSSATPPPLFVLRAEGINPSDLYASGFYKVVPAQMMVPLVGLHVTVVSAEEGTPTHFSRFPAATLITNSSGLTSRALLQGEYEIEISGSAFAVSTVVTMTDNTTTSLNFILSPSAKAVSALRVISQDTSLGLEPTSRMYALLNYTTAPSQGFCELVGLEPPLRIYPWRPYPPNPGLVVDLNVTAYGWTQTSLNATVVGSYPGTQGYWATLTPLGNSSVYPTVADMLFHFTPTVLVNYTAG